VVDATEHLLGVADDFRPRRVDLGLAGERHFVFSAGVGLDASVTERVDAHPYRKARLGPWYYSYVGIAVFSRRYLVRPPRVRLEAGGRSLEAVTVIAQNSDPFTYFSRRPIRVCEQVGLDTGSLSLAAMRRATPFEIPTLIPRLLSGRPGTVLRHRQIEGVPAVTRARVESVDERPFPVQVDGDFIGEYAEMEFGVVPGGLVAVS
jgi:diacylglycerol kinase family enzyme